jgi:hypothetical protein
MTAMAASLAHPVFTSKWMKTPTSSAARTAWLALATDEVTLVFASQTIKALDVQLLDVQGRKIPVSISGMETDFVKLNTSNVVPGMYFVQVRTAEGSFAKKLIIE